MDKPQKMEQEEYIKKWLDGTLTEEERVVFEKTEQYRNLSKLSDALRSFKAPAYHVAAEYERLVARRDRKPRVVAMNWWGVVLKVAAVIVVLVGGYLFFLSSGGVVIETLAGEKSIVNLPDSSFVALNAMSRLTYDERKWKDERRVDLDGEAFFRVAKGSRFDVVTSSGTISVLGTSFNVRNRQDFFEVTCYEGSVQVKSVEVVKLSPQQVFRLVQGVVTKGETGAAENQPDWRRGESSFRSVPYQVVLQEFERQFNVSVVTRNVDQHRLFTGTFTHADFSIALESIALPFNLSYEVEGKKIILTGEH